MAEVYLRAGWLIPFYSLLGILLTIPWMSVRRTGPRPAGYLNLATTVLALVHALLALSAVWGQEPLRLSIGWMQVADLSIELPFELSTLNLVAVVVVTTLNLLAQIYAIGYMEMDWGWARLYSLLALFEAGMTALLLCDSVFFSYMMLEILTLGTYLIVGFWFNQPRVVTGARDAFLTKRVGDLILLMGLIALYPLAGTWSYSELAQWSSDQPIEGLTATLVGLALLAGPISKCAQFPLHLWLDSAMEGPLPTTILRNSVVIPVGAWVLIKLTPVLALSPVVDTVAVAIGTITAIGGALISIAQIDTKRVLSYLTSAFMGLILIAVGTSQVGVAYFLLMTFSVAIAALIASTGSIVFTCVTQDLTLLGGLWSRRPVTALSFIFGALGILGLPPFGGFWAMRFLETGLWYDGQILPFAIVLAINGLCAFSLVRMFCLIFVGQPKAMSTRAPEPLWAIVLPMAIMAALTLHVPIMLQTLKLLPIMQTAIGETGLLLIWSTMLGLGLGFVFYGIQREKLPADYVPQWMTNLFAYDFYTPGLYKNLLIWPVASIASVFDWVERYIIDGLVNLVGALSLLSGETLKYSNPGRSQLYVLTITVCIVLLGIVMTLSTMKNLGQLTAAF
ncbi:NAD(P)H-quinone oxidoreductase subunit F [Leptolyngbyaceae cyanobacterium CCMR0082]|uniref:NAD(P)H-quinone oxidoreductase subunit F n=2 Tax=Adonisia turfae TaxID=2950184 RepID=A0A6M0S5D2_9CYAN|nr:NAD(P)H-quinone oxidoreductase subunit F [Adonisia turfae]MDV3353441.1 NAD(P)H-quinone oxidoreductase subunit F [Leptothoe sp. LEGE 181152]NEZ56700.1 NAD(P)H-quinone oxidoreductase subunit F [Adonisia turfae CCMR0081]NEZ63709.1 NAD(P)H-quinone oxidoreductase subunit F [Adonisia turfae CCMR0082]